ncbi:MAG TPA: VWA domain-containing protein [Candidatus Sulfotelmatobacter sp.]|nr:VWA domain-containing protein [Candidatus Sulfotelmatobacter sp.]
MFSIPGSLLVFSQTSLDDVHVAPRETSTALKMASSIDPAGSGIHVIHTDSRLVLVPVSVTDPMQRFVTGLNRDNFEVYEGKKPQAIQHFSSEDVPVSLGIILDISGSMGDKMERVREAVNQFCEASNPQDQFFLITFADEPRLATDFTSNPEDLKKELLFTQSKGRTALLDAIHMGLRKMKNAKYGKRALLIISDGGDNHSRYGDREIRGLAKESDVMIYSIGIFDRYVPTPEELRGPSLLAEIAEPTGGRAFTVDNPNIMPSLARHIGLELRTQYVLAYRPQDAPRNGKWRKIRVKLRLPRRFAFLQAHAKTGYYASAEPEPVTSFTGEEATRR